MEFVIILCLDMHCPFEEELAVQLIILSFIGHCKHAHVGDISVTEKTVTIKL